MWLDRFSGQSTPSQSPNRSSSPLPLRRSSHLAPNAYPRRPGINPRASVLSVAAFGRSTDSLPAAARVTNGSSLRNQLDSSLVNEAPNPLDVLGSIIGPLRTEGSNAGDDSFRSRPDELFQNVEFNGLSLKEYAAAEERTRIIGENTSGHVVPTQTVADCEAEKDEYEDLHKSILACDDVLKSVETYLTSFQADLAAVSAEIETLQNRSTALNTKLQNRKVVEKVLGPEVDAFSISPAVVRKITEGAVDDGWIRALEELEKRSKSIDAKLMEGRDIKAAQDIRPFLDDVSNTAIERIRDYVVAQIKALRSPSVNAQVIQQSAFLKYKGVLAFLARRQPQLTEEINQAYINTMRWYYHQNFGRYRTALEKLNLHTIDQTDAIALDKPAKAGIVHRTTDAFSLGRRIDLLRTSSNAALSSYMAEEDKSTHYLDSPFRAFNLALVDNASAEYVFLSAFFAGQSFHAVNRKFTEIFAPTFELGQALTKQLIENSLDALGILLCVRLNQHFAFELQRRKVPAVDGYINGTNMLLWPRFQQVIDAHCDSIRKLTATLPGKPTNSALSLTSSPSTSQSTAPHPLTQRFANLLQGILALSSEAGDDEPVSNSLGRLRSNFEAFLVKLSKGIAEARKRERFLYNNYSLIGTILADTEGKLAEEVRGHFDSVRDGLRV